MKLLFLLDIVSTAQPTKRSLVSEESRIIVVGFPSIAVHEGLVNTAQVEAVKSIGNL